MTHDAARRFIRREAQRLRKLSAQWKQDHLPSLTASIERYAAGQAQLGAGVAPLLVLASFRSVDGIVRVLDGDAGGFQEIDLACLYNAWALRILVRAFELDPRPGKQPRIQMETMATCWMHARAIDASEILSVLGELVAKQTAGPASIGGKHMSPLCGLLACWSLRLSVDAAITAGWAAPGPYEHVVRGTMDPGDYSALAEYHIKRTGGGGFPEFQLNPYSVVPVELLAIERETGIRIPDDAHPLLASPLAARRTVTRIPETEELDRVVSTATKELGLA